MNSLLTSAVEQVVNKMIPIVASAGNDDQSACFQNPGSEPLVFTVGATDNQDNKLTRSNHGSCLDIFVPGGGIESAHPTLGYVTKSGTSMAAPLQAGVFAALLSTYSYPNIDALYKQVIDWSTKGIVQCIPNIETPNRLLYVPFPKWEPQPKL
jgi:subtilisin family serine protease